MTGESAKKSGRPSTYPQVPVTVVALGTLIPSATVACLREKLVELRVLVCSWDDHQSRQGPEGAALQLVLLLELLLDRVGLDLGGDCQLQGLHQLVQSGEDHSWAELGHPGQHQVGQHLDVVVVFQTVLYGVTQV